MKSLSLGTTIILATLWAGSSFAQVIPAMAANGSLIRGTTVSKSKLKKKKKVEEKKTSEASGLSGSLVVTEDLPIEAKGNWTRLEAYLNYNFYKSYTLGFGGTYSKPYGEPDPYYDGFGDLGISISDSKLVDLEDRGFTIAGSLGYVVPLSRASREATLQDGFKVGLTTTQKFGDKFSLIYGTTIARYFHQVDADPTGATYNKPYDWSNELTAVYKITDKVTWAATGGVYTSLSYTAPKDENAEFASDDYNRENKFLVATGVSWKWLDNLTLRANVRSLRSEYSKRALFDAATTMFRVGATLSF